MIVLAARLHFSPLSSRDRFPLFNYPLKSLKDAQRHLPTKHSILRLAPTERISPTDDPFSSAIAVQAQADEGAGMTRSPKLRACPVPLAFLVRLVSLYRLERAA